MSPEAQQIAIAKARGFTNIGIHQTEPYFDGEGWNVNEYEGGIVDGIYKPIPDYLNDLNAMHEAEKVLFAMDGRFHINEGCRTRYLDNLLLICRGGFHAGIHATAAQRAEAFLRTLNLWTNEAKP